MSGAVLLLLFVTVQRGAELLLSRRNTARLMEAGAHEAGAAHYPLMVGFHAAWLAGLWLLGPGREVDPFWFVAFLILQLGRLWVIATLGKRWTTRIIVKPGARLIRRGPYRLVQHPNYWVVAGEIAVLPLALGLPWYALAFSVAHLGVLWVRIRAENLALASSPGASTSRETRTERGEPSLR